MESTLRISPCVRRATSMARADLPDAVGPRITSRSVEVAVETAITAPAVKVAGNSIKRRSELSVASYCFYITYSADSRVQYLAQSLLKYKNSGRSSKDKV